MNIKSVILYLWTAIVFVLIAWPTPEYNGTVFTWYDKFGHAILFGLFFFLLAEVFSEKSFFQFNRRVIFAAAIAVFYSAFCEFVQNFVPGRTVSEYDFFAGVTGIIFAMIIFYAIYKNKKT